MGKIPIVLSMIVLLLMPVYASAQIPDSITILENFGDHTIGEPLFIHGQVANIIDGDFLIMQIINPNGDLCQIQQLTTLSNGAFTTDVIPLKGRICGITGEYEIKLFYGDNFKSATFTVTPDTFAKVADERIVTSAQNLVSDQSELIGKLFDIASPAVNTSSRDLSNLESEYVRLWSDYFIDDLLYELDPLVRPIIASSLDSVQQLLDDDEISFEIAKSLDKKIFTTIFYSEIGDKTKSANLLNDVFVDVRNITPDKTITKRTPTFDELEETLLNLMTKSGTIMSKPVKHEIGFIFARGTAPLYSDQITDLIDILSKARYLDVISRKQSDLYNIIQSEWESLKPSFESKETIDDLLLSHSDVSKLHAASILLRELDDVSRFIASDENSDLVYLILSDWDALESRLSSANSVDDILSSEDDIYQMTQIIDITTRISKSVEISQDANVNSSVTNNWRLLLDKVKDASSVDEILSIISEFDQSMAQLREKRNPLVILEFEYNAMKEQAELQADYGNLVLIDNALKILDTAKQMESGNPSISRIDRIQILLTWVNEIAPQIRSDLDSYNQEVFKIRASDILQKAKSIENLVQHSITKNRFLPNYVEFTNNFTERVDTVRDLVIANDLKTADDLVSNLFDEWILVSEAYANDPNGSKVGYTVDEIKRIELREKLDDYKNAVSTFHNSDFSTHVADYNVIVDDAYDLIELGNFIDAESKITEIGDFLSEYLVLSNSSIFYDVSFDLEKNIWIISGATDKSTFDRRENLYLTVYNADGSNHSNLEFTDTRQGNFYTQWIAPTDPGLYVIQLQYSNSKATQIIHIAEEFDYQYTPSDLNMVELSREFNELYSFAQEFGGANFEKNPRFATVVTEIKSGLVDKDTQSVNDSLDELKSIIERYLPIRSRVAVVEAQYGASQLVVSGAVQKTIEFSEDLYVDVFDQRGELVKEIALKDDSSGFFTEVLNYSFDPGLYVVQLEYHNLVVTDFFSVR